MKSAGSSSGGGEQTINQCAPSKWKSERERAQLGANDEERGLLLLQRMTTSDNRLPASYLHLPAAAAASP